VAHFSVEKPAQFRVETNKSLLIASSFSGGKACGQQMMLGP
jgi:hypothetical protein